MALQDDYMINNVKDTVRLICRLLFGEAKLPDYRIRQEGSTPESDELFRSIIFKADKGEINDAENLLLVNMDMDDSVYLELALTFYMKLNDMDTDYLDDHGYSREEILDGVKSLAEEWGVSGLEYF